MIGAYAIGSQSWGAGFFGSIAIASIKKHLRNASINVSRSRYITTTNTVELNFAESAVAVVLAAANKNNGRGVTINSA